MSHLSRINISNYLILVFAFLLPISLEGLRVVISLMIVFWVLDPDRFDVELPKPFKIFFIFIGVSVLSYTWGSSDFKEVLEYVRRYWYFFPAFFVYKYIDNKAFVVAISVFLFSMFISEMVSYGIYFELIDPIGKSSVKDPTPFMHHTSYSVFLAITAIILINRFLVSDNYRSKLFFLLFIFGILGNLFINSGRTGQIAFSLTLFIVFLYIYEFKIKRLFFLFFSVCLIYFMAYSFSSNFNNRMNEMKIDIENIVIHDKYTSNLGTRAGFWIISKEIFKERPIAGVGVASHINYLKNKIKSNNPHLILSGNHEHFHSQYLNIFAQLGILGLLIYIYFLFSIARVRVFNREVNVFKIGLMSIFMLGFFVDTLLRFNIDIMLFSFMVGIVLAKNKFESADKFDKIS